MVCGDPGQQPAAAVAGASTLAHASVRRAATLDRDVARRWRVRGGFRRGTAPGRRHGAVPAAGGTARGRGVRRRAGALARALELEALRAVLRRRGGRGRSTPPTADPQWTARTACRERPGSSGSRAPPRASGAVRSRSAPCGGVAGHSAPRGLARPVRAVVTRGDRALLYCLGDSHARVFSRVARAAPAAAHHVGRHLGPGRDRAGHGQPQLAAPTRWSTSAPCCGAYLSTRRWWCCSARSTAATCSGTAPLTRGRTSGRSSSRASPRTPGSSTSCGRRVVPTSSCRPCLRPRLSTTRPGEAWTTPAGTSTASIEQRTELTGSTTRGFASGRAVTAAPGCSTWRPTCSTPTSGSCATSSSTSDPLNHHLHPERLRRAGRRASARPRISLSRADGSAAAPSARRAGSRSAPAPAG